MSSNVSESLSTFFWITLWCLWQVALSSSVVAFCALSWDACLKLNTAPPLMCPCAPLCDVKRVLRCFFCHLPRSLCSHSLRMPPSRSSLGSSPRSLVLSGADRGGDGAAEALAPRRWLEQRLRKALWVASFYFSITLYHRSSLLWSPKIFKRMCELKMCRDRVERVQMAPCC